MADDFLILPNFASNPGADTYVYSPDNRDIDAYFRAAENQYRRKVFDYNKERAEIQDRIAALDLNTAGTWERDLPDVNKGVEGFIGYVDENPTSVTPTKDNLKDYLEQRKMYGELEYKVAQSKSDRAMYDATKKMIATNPKLRPHAADYMQQLEDWASKPLGERGDFALQIKPDWNILADQDKKMKLLQYDNPQLKATPDQYGNVTYTMDSGEPKTDALIEYEKNRFDLNDEQAQAAAEQFTELPADKKAQYQQDGSDGVKNYYVDMELSAIPLNPKVKQQIRSNWMMQFGVKEEAKGSQDAWIVDTGTQLYDPNSKVWQGTTAKGFQYAPAPSGTYLKAPASIFTAADGVSKTSIGSIGLFVRDDKGQLYAVPTERVTRTPTGAYTWETKDIVKAKVDNDLIPINNYNDQVITPSLDRKYKGSPNYNFNQDIQNYAPVGDPNDVLKIPRKKENQTTTKSETKYVLKGYGSFTHKQLVDAGYTEEQIKKLQTE